ncbi:hypothetical protein FRC08_007682 [Ceratobasidium sp. 394]|nr:hypothetical protein FRC08_007682 [Ceratobasidium sp. 394]
MQFLEQMLDDDIFNSEPDQTPAGQGEGSSTGPSPDDNVSSDLNANGRRGRSDSEPNVEEAARLARRAFMDTFMDEHNIRGPAREQGQRFADLDPSSQSMYIFSFVLAQRHQVDNQAASDFLRSDIYETHVVGRIRVAMLLPWVCDYVKLFTETLVNNILQNPEAWRIPEPIITQTEQRQHFIGEVKIKTTQVRSQNKISLYRMRGRGVDINEMTRTLAPRGMVITEVHCARLAWIMLASVEFDELVEQKEQARTKFWEWIGGQVLELKKRIQNDARLTTDAERRATLARVFNRALAKHRDQFPPQAPVEPPQVRPGWQETLEVSLNMGAAI